VANILQKIKKIIIDILSIFCKKVEAELTLLPAKKIIIIIIIITIK
jgi:hypothetical protein